MPRPTGNARKAGKDSLMSGRFHSIHKGWEQKRFPPFVYRAKAAISLLSGWEKEWKESWILTLTFWDIKTSLQRPAKPGSCLRLLQPRNGCKVPALIPFEI